MVDWIQTLGRHTIAISAGFGRSGAFLLKSLWRWPKPIRTFPLLIQEIFSVGVLSLPIILVSALFIGMVVALQGYNILQKFSAASELGQMVAITINFKMLTLNMFCNLLFNLL